MSDQMPRPAQTVINFYRRELRTASGTISQGVADKFEDRL